MKDYKKSITIGNSIYPLVSIGTFGRTYEELLELFSCYPYNALWIDTAYRYENESIVADALENSGFPLQKVIFTGKICYSQQIGDKSVEEELLGTLRRLKIPKIDIYLIHSPRYEHYCETWIEMKKLRDKGLINIIGVSNFDVDDLEKLYQETGEYPSINQIAYCLKDDRDLQKEALISFCKSKNIVIQVARPFGGPELAKILTEEERKKILQKNCENQVVSVLGTSSAKHMMQNLLYILGE